MSQNEAPPQPSPAGLCASIAADQVESPQPVSRSVANLRAAITGCQREMEKIALKMARAKRGGPRDSGECSALLAQRKAFERKRSELQRLLDHAQ